MTFATNLKNLREQNNITQEQLAEYLQVSRATVAGYETKNHQPDFERLVKIAQYFEVSTGYLLFGSQASTLDTPNENALDAEVFSIYRCLNMDSKKEVLRYMHLLKLWEEKTKK